MTLSSKHLQGQLSPPLDTRSATRCPLAGDEIWTHGTYGHGRNHPRESQRDRATPPRNICPITLPVVAGSHRHVHLIDAGIHVQDETVHAPAGLYADKDGETIAHLKCVASEVAFGPIRAKIGRVERRAGNDGHRDPHHATFHRVSYDSLYRQSICGLTRSRRHGRNEGES